MWNATATFLAVIIISLLLDEAGSLNGRRCTLRVGAVVRIRKLLAFIVLLGAVVSALFANDGAALILTPIVMAMLVALGFSPAADASIRHGGWVHFLDASQQQSSRPRQIRSQRQPN